MIANSVGSLVEYICLFFVIPLWCPELILGPKFRCIVRYAQGPMLGIELKFGLWKANTLSTVVSF